MLKSVKAKTPKIIEPEHVASVAVSDEVAFSNHVLFELAIACGKNVRLHHLSKLFQTSSDHSQRKITERRTLVDPPNPRT